MSAISREFHLVRRPAGLPTVDDFTIVSTTLPDPSPGHLLVRNRFLSVDPYMRGRMVDAKSYVPPFQLNAPLQGGAVGVVEESAHPDFRVGDTVLSMHGWREAYLSDGKGLTRVDPTLAPPQAFLGVLGMPGLTGYVGLTAVGGLADGETVLVSGAAGAVGMVVCQIAKARGCRVIGVVGSDEKAAWLTQAGVDATVNYRTAPNLRKAIGAAAPDGVDLTFENVGGEHLEAAAACAKPFGRIVICGLISQYNATDCGIVFRNIAMVLIKRLTVRGFIVSDHRHLEADFRRAMSAWIGAGVLKWTDTTVVGFEQTPTAFLGLFSGVNLGKMIVRI